MRQKATFLICSVVAVLILATTVSPSRAPAAPTAAPAQQPPAPKTYDLNKITCRDLDRADILDRSSAIMFLWGYEAGRRNVTAWTTTDLENATRRLMDTCQAKPSLSLFAALAATRKNSAK